MVRDRAPRRRAWVALAAATVAGLLVGSSTTPTASALVMQSTRADAVWVDRYNDRLVSLVNARRADQGLRQVTTAACAEGWAQRWSSHLAREDQFEHSDMGGLLHRCDAVYAAENIAMIYDGARPGDLVRLWMGSPGHRANILSRKARLTGVSIRWDDNRDAWIAVQTFVRR
jgi:uncharacterized protein YkwD